MPVGRSSQSPASATIVASHDIRGQQERVQLDVTGRLTVSCSSFHEEDAAAFMATVISGLPDDYRILSSNSTLDVVDLESDADIFNVHLVISAVTEDPDAIAVTANENVEVTATEVRLSPLPVTEERAIAGRLRAVRTSTRSSTGVCHPDPRTGAPMIGTGHCHDTCMHAETEELVMAGGFFRHPDGFDYGHSWLVHRATGVIVDPTSDQWHREEFEDVAFIPHGDPRRSRYITGRPSLDEDGYWSECEYEPPEEFSVRTPPVDPALRGR